MSDRRLAMDQFVVKQQLESVHIGKRGFNQEKQALPYHRSFIFVFIFLYSKIYQSICLPKTYKKTQSYCRRPSTITGLDWTVLKWTGLEKIVSNTDNDSIGLGWKRSSKNKCNFVALSLQLVREWWNTNCMWNSHRL